MVVQKYYLLDIPQCLFIYSQIFQDRDSLSLKLEDTENWLYEDGEDQPKQVYIDKLAELKVIFFIFFYNPSMGLERECCKS